MKTHPNTILILIPALILSACAPAQTPAVPTAAPLPSPTLTSTPLPSATPTLTAAPLPTDTPTPLPTLTPTPLPKLDFEANLTLQDVVKLFYQTGDFELLASLLDELTKYYKAPAVIGRLYALEGDAYARQGSYESAADSYLKALQKFPAVQQINLDLCRVYKLMEQAEQALPFCEKAATANPSFWTYLYRGQVYALLGRLGDAEKDFAQVAKQLKSSSGVGEQMIYQDVAGWLEALQKGVNPITPELLASDRQLEMASALPTQTADEKAAPSSEMLQKAAASFGFGPFAEVNVKDPFQDINLPFIGSSMSMGACTVDLALQASDEMIYKLIMTMKGCNYQEEYFLALRLIDQFFPDKRQKAEAVLWLFKEANHVIEAQQAEAETINIRKCNLYAGYNRTDQSTQLLFSCH